MLLLVNKEVEGTDMQLKQIKIPNVKGKCYKIPAVSRNDLAIAELEKGRHVVICSIIPGKWQVLGNFIHSNDGKIPTFHWDETGSKVPAQLISTLSLVDWAVQVGKDWADFQVDFV